MAQTLQDLAHRTAPRGRDRRPAPVGGNQAVRRAIAILKAFSDQAPEMGISELSRRIGLHKSTIYRLLSAFDDEGLVARNPENGRYRLGPELIVLGEQFLRHNEVHRVALPHLRDLAEQAGETLDLQILSAGNVVTIEEIPGRHVVAAAGSIGTTWAAHATSNGKVLLADLPPARQRAILSRTLTRFTPRTITDPGQLALDLLRVRKQGYAISNGELENHLVAIGIPVRGRDGRVVAAVSLSGPDTRLTPARLPALIRLGVSTCSRISARLGYHDAAPHRSAGATGHLRRRHTPVSDAT